MKEERLKDDKLKYFLENIICMLLQSHTQTKKEKNK